MLLIYVALPVWAGTAANSCVLYHLWPEFSVDEPPRSVGKSRPVTVTSMALCPSQN